LRPHPNLGLAYVSRLVETEEEDEEREREAMGDGARFFICSPRSSYREDKDSSKNKKVE
jgi:hypothetical protein